MIFFAATFDYLVWMFSLSMMTIGMSTLTALALIGCAERCRAKRQEEPSGDDDILASDAISRSSLADNGISVQSPTNGTRKTNSFLKTMSGRIYKTLEFLI